MGGARFEIGGGGVTVIASEGVGAKRRPIGRFREAIQDFPD
jgi:hypothetical protein